MSVRARLGLVIMWAASLVALAELAKAQVQVSPVTSPIVLSGSDIGFRVEGKIGNTPAGTLVIRVNNQWVVPTTASGPARLRPN